MNRIHEQKWCSSVLPRVSRTFALSIETLPENLRDAVRTAYLLCRIVDTVEDQANLRPDERTALFDAFDATIQDDEHDSTEFETLAQRWQLDADGADGELCQKASIVFRRFRGLAASQRRAIRPHVAEMSVGMREFAQRAQASGRLYLEDVPDLERYCYFVAGTVGELLTALFELMVSDIDSKTAQALRERAVSFGLGLQMVNIVKDVASDHGRGDCYLPRSLAAAHGVTLEGILDPKHRDAGLAVVRDVCRIAGTHLGRAREYTLLWPSDSGRDIRLFCAVPLALALATLYEVEQGENALLVGCEPKVSRASVMAIFAGATQAIQHNAALSELFERCERGEYR